LGVDLSPPRSGTQSKFRSLDFAVPKNNVPPGRNFWHLFFSGFEMCFAVRDVNSVPQAEVGCNPVAHQATGNLAFERIVDTHHTPQGACVVDIAAHDASKSLSSVFCLDRSSAAELRSRRF